MFHCTSNMLAFVFGPAFVIYIIYFFSLLCSVWVGNHPTEVEVPLLFQSSGVACTITFHCGTSFEDPFYFIVFCHFPVWCPGSGVVLDCIDFGSLPPYLL